jgi:hypothetical protein
MTTHPTSTWSESQQQRTREAIEQIPVTPDGLLHFKHPTMGYAFANLEDLMHDRLILHAQKGSGEHRFEGVDALLQAGWAVD